MTVGEPATPPGHTPSLAWLRYAAAACGAAIGVVGAVALAGWFTGNLLFAQIRPEFIPVAPATALSFLLSGLALLWPLAVAPQRGRLAARICAALIILLALLRVWELVTGSNLPISMLLFKPPPTPPGMAPLGKMALPTVLSFLAAGMSMLLLTMHRRQIAALGPAFITAVMGVTFVLGYVYGRPLLYGGGTIPMALPTAIAFCLLGAGLILLIAGQELTARNEIDRRLRLHERLATQRNLLEAMVHHAPVGMALFDAQDLRVRLHNPGLSPLLAPEFRDKDLTGLTLHQIVTGAEESGVADIYRSTVAGQTHTFSEFEFTGTGGSPRFYNWATVPIPRPGEDRFDVLVIAYEVTEQVQARRRVEELAAEAQRQATWLQTVLASMPGGVAVYDAEGRIIQMNEAGQRLLHYTAEDFSVPLAQRLTRVELLDGDGQPITADQTGMARALRGEVVSGQALRVRVGDFPPFWLSVNAAPIRQPDGSLSGAVVIFLDITSQQQAQEELREHRNHLEELVQQRTKQLLQHQGELRRLTAQLAIVEEQERSRIGNAIHDEISQLLAFARMQVNLMRDKEPSRAMAADIEALDDLIGQAIASSRSLTTELSPPVLYEMDFLAALQWLGEQMERRHGLRTHVEVAEELRNLPQDCRITLFQGTRELLTNAAKHAQAQNVWVALTKRDDHLRLTVRDDGKGFAPGQLQVSERGGFGLFALRERLIYMGGELRIESAPGKGASFTVVLPVGQKGCASPLDRLQGAVPIQGSVPGESAQPIAGD